MTEKRKAVSLFSGAGGMDVGFSRAGFEIVFANDFDPIACKTYTYNHNSEIKVGDINNFFGDLSNLAGKVDLVFGGPPCQGFSVAGKMDPNDPRSKLLWSYLDVVSLVQPSVFVCENVKALGALEKWKDVRFEFLKRASKLGYETSFIILNSQDFNVPQSRERVFFIGVKGSNQFNLEQLFSKYKKKSPSVKEMISGLGKPGNDTHLNTCNAVITLASNPVLRKSPYAGMLFNGLGRPVKLNGYCSTLPASMGGNKTPIIDEAELYEGEGSWVEAYHKKLMAGELPPEFKEAPKRLRRLTLKEAIIIQTFPLDYRFAGGNSAIYRQIGNAVPCNLAEAVGKVASDLLDGIMNYSDTDLFDQARLVLA
ncbi:DNA cytosine methyltransferase [Leptospira brenneri]|uniref:Cytosine-specific methyltransferase n=1 Tax=Leptospira brenneri TaxID=2023182 RepID=A0A5F1Z675_9LEPT|nr:DNA cytosine methyltransferase [Leptospira brenneri]TGK94064.1 DNA cytosine methyltransferase [Leptospira brenneri]